MGRAAQVAIGAVAAAAIFGAGVLAANALNDPEEAVPQQSAESIAETDRLLLQQILVKSEDFNTITDEVRSGEVNERRVEAASVELIKIGAQVEQLASGMQNEDLRNPSQDLGAAYVQAGVGLVAGDSERVASAVEDINTATQEIQAEINPQGSDEGTDGGTDGGDGDGNTDGGSE